MTVDRVQDRLARAVAQHNAGRIAEAELGYRAVLDHMPDNAAALHLLGMLLAQTGRPGEGEPFVVRAASLRPGDADIQLSLGTIRRALGNATGAEAALRTALTLNPGCAPACLQLGILMEERGRQTDAEGLFTRAVTADAQLAEGWVRLGSLADIRGDIGRAADCLEKALALRATPRSALLGRLIGASAKLGRWDRVASLRPALAQAVEQDRDGATPLDVLIGQPLVEEWHLRTARAMAGALRRRVATLPARPREAAATTPVRIGYLCADFRRQTGAARIIAAHDRRAVDVWCFDLSAGPGASAPEPLKAGRFIGLRGEDTAAAARRLHAAGLDVLVDVDGLARPEVLAQRPAGAIVHWPGHPGTLGGLADYVLADPAVIPPGRERFYAEAVIRLQTSCVRPDMVAPANPVSRQAAGLPAQGPVFAAFHPMDRIGKEAFSGWMRILAATPAPVLWLLQPPAEAARTFLEAAVAAGVDPRRIVFARTGWPEGMSDIALADLFLDSRPVGAGAEAAQALAAGVPVLTCMGEMFGGRRAASLLYALGLDELVTAGPSAFEATATALANDPPVLAALRGKLARTLPQPTSPFNAARTARMLEAACLTIAERVRRGLPPTGFSLQEDVTA